MSLETERILGIDPGFGRMGYGIIEGRKDQWRCITHGCIVTEPKDLMADRLRTIFDALQELIHTYQPSRCGLEKLFFHKNTTTAIEVGQARGVALMMCSRESLKVVELTPLQVKQSVTGYGRAEKSQVQKMITLLLKLPSGPLQDDAADALAIAFAVSGLKEI